MMWESESDSNSPKTAVTLHSMHVEVNQHTFSVTIYLLNTLISWHPFTQMGLIVLHFHAHDSHLKEYQKFIHTKSMLLLNAVKPIIMTYHRIGVISTGAYFRN